uniref:Natriuretic peptide A n=2 Tax=Lepisosteus oculatus TaxID=7918 RepID=W5ME75_LEPOC
KGMAKLDVYCSFLILLIIYNAARASTLFNRYSTQDLDTLKDIIERLEEKLTPSEENELYPGSEELSMDSGEDALVSPGILRQQEENLLLNPNRLIQENSPRSRLRDLAGLARTTKSFGGCFGNRVDRIGSWSGLGCNSSKFGTKKRIFGN